jgi:hypothetical protein
MAAIVIMEGICAAGIVFMICFLAVLLRGRKRKPFVQVVHLLTQHPETQSDRFSLITGTRSGKSDTSRRPQFEVLAGGTESPARRVG